MPLLSLRSYYYCYYNIYIIISTARGRRRPSFSIILGGFATQTPHACGGPFLVQTAVLHPELPPRIRNCRSASGTAGTHSGTITIVCRSASGTAALPPELPEQILCRNAIRNCRVASGTAGTHPMPFAIRNCHITSFAARPPELPKHILCREHHPELPFTLRNCRNTPASFTLLVCVRISQELPFFIRNCRSPDFILLRRAQCAS
jgi:hypothetical protein